MNKKRRKRLEDVIDILNDLSMEIELIREEEQEAYDNMPESLQLSEKGETIEENVSVLEDAQTDVETIIENLNEIL